jgi:DNA-binding CsgD family transcriptional regulator
MRRVDAEHIERASRRLGEAALDPALWPEIMEEVCAAAGATGASLLQTDVRTSDVPSTPGIGELFRLYFRDGWHARDSRAERGVPLVVRGEVITDQDLFTPDELCRDMLYNECLYPTGFRWFAVIGFRAGSAFWGLSMQRTTADGPFEAPDKFLLKKLSDPLTEAATLSTAVGRVVISGMTDALSLVQRPALVVDRMGCVLACNAEAERLFGDDIRVSNRRLFLHDPQARSALAELLDRMRTTPDTDSLPADPIVVRRAGGHPVVIRVLPVPAAARSPFLGARALLTLTEPRPQPGPEPRLLASLFGLTAAEARLASLMASGGSPEVAASRLGISRETARNQLKAVFLKTETHRQGELVALLAQLGAAAS